MKWGNLTEEQIKEIINGASKKVKYEVSWRFPFVIKTTWIFGGHCGICGKWNWQWTMIGSILGATYACIECQR